MFAYLLPTIETFQCILKEYDPYNLEKPLLVCVGKCVNKRSNLTKRRKGIISDVRRKF